jgi:S-adenosylmethionine decarboxylase
MANIGTHLLADLYGVETSLLRDEKALMRIFRGALVQEGFTILDQVRHRFADGGQGVTGMFLLSVSHATFHTFPEHAYMAVDIFSCGTADPNAVLRVLTETLKPERVETQQTDRGEQDR